MEHANRLGGRYAPTGLTHRLDWQAFPFPCTMILLLFVTNIEQPKARAKMQDEHMLLESEIFGSVYHVSHPSSTMSWKNELIQKSVDASAGQVHTLDKSSLQANDE